MPVNVYVVSLINAGVVDVDIVTGVVELDNVIDGAFPDGCAITLYVKIDEPVTPIYAGAVKLTV